MLGSGVVMLSLSPPPSLLCLPLFYCSLSSFISLSLDNQCFCVYHKGALISPHPISAWECASLCAVLMEIVAMVNNHGGTGEDDGGCEGRPAMLVCVCARVW